MDAPATSTPDIWITAVMTGPSGANMPQRKVNRAEWRYRYRQRHPSESGGGGRRGLNVHQSRSDQLQNYFCVIFSCRGIKACSLGTLQVQDKTEPPLIRQTAQTH